MKSNYPPQITCCYCLVFALLFCCAFSGQVVYTQDVKGGVGVFKEKNTNEKSKSAPAKTKNKNSAKSTSRQQETIPLTILSRNGKYSFIVMYKNDLKNKKVALRVRGILLRYGYKPEQFSYTSQPSQLYDYDRKPNNAYLSFDSSVPPEIRDEVSKLVREVIPSVHIDIMNKSADDYFLLWLVL